MVTLDKLDKLYNIVINGEELTIHSLNLIGFTSDDISQLIKNNTLESLDNGHLRFIDVNSLFQYGKRLIAQKKRSEANKCYLKCYEIDNNHLATNANLLLDSVDAKEFEKVFKYLDFFITNNNSKYKSDYNLYIFLLSFLAEMPEKYKNIFESMKLDDVLLTEEDKRYEDIEFQNKIRSLIFKGKFPHAIKLLNDYTMNSYKITVYDIILKSLLIQTQNVLKDSKSKALELIKNKEYEEVVKLFENEGKKRLLSTTEKRQLKLVNEIINLQKNGQIIEPQIFNTSKLSEAIDGNNYELALFLVSDFYKSKITDKNENVIYLLLDELCRMLKETEQSYIKIDSIIESLQNNKLREAFRNLRLYLDSIGQRQYEFLVNNLIKISYFKKDAEFTSPLDVLNALSNNDFVFNINKYREDFYFALANKEIDIAKFYLEIIIKANFLYKYNIDTEVLDKELREAAKKNNDHNTSVKEFIAIQYEKVVAGSGMILLEHMDALRRHEIYEIVKEYPDLAAFSINELPGDIKQLVLRYKPILKEHINAREYREKGNIAYYSGDYIECINIYTTLLKIGRPNASIYAKLGLSYLKIGKKGIAIQFLEVANYLSKEENYSSYDFTELIDKLKNPNSNEEELKPVFTMQTDEFDYQDDYYGIENIIEITEYVIGSGIEINSALKELGFNEEQINIIILIYAKEYYKNGYYEKGDQFIKFYERSSYKTNITNCIANEIRKNRKIYANRINENKLNLSLTLKP